MSSVSSSSGYQAEEDAIKLLMGESHSSTNYIALVNVSRVTGFISIVASACIIWDVYQKKAWKSTANRIILCMSICDIVLSLVCNVIGTIMMPKDLAWGAMGNWATCTAQGFLLPLFMEPASFFNTNLSVYYVICVRLGWREDKFRRPLIQFWLFGLPILLGLTLAIWGLVDGAYTVTLWACSLAPSPVGCMEVPELVGECTRGYDAYLIQQIRTYTLITFTAVIMVSVLILYYSVLEKERRNDRYVQEGQAVNRKLSNRVAMQGVYYSFCFLLTYSFYYVFVFGYYIQDKSHLTPYWLTVMMAITFPFGGFFNAIVYFRQNKPTDADTARGVWQSLKKIRSSVARSSVVGSWLSKSQAAIITTSTSKLDGSTVSLGMERDQDESSSPAIAFEVNPEEENKEEEEEENEGREQQPGVDVDLPPTEVAAVAEAENSYGHA